jgi:hypothetical protein
LILVPTILILEKNKKLAKGASFGVYVAMYAFIRFVMELLRTDTTFRVLGISRNGWVSIAAFIGGVAWIIYTQRRGEKRTLIGKPTFFSPQPANTFPEDTPQSTVESSQSADDAEHATELPDAVPQHRPSWSGKAQPQEESQDES